MRFTKGIREKFKNGNCKKSTQELAMTESRTQGYRDIRCTMVSI